MDPLAWHSEAHYVCEGIDHQDAPEVDAAAAAHQLKATVDYYAARDGAPSKRGRKPASS